MNKEIIAVVRKYQQLVNTQDKNLFEEIFAANSPCSLISVATKFTGKGSIYQDFLLNGIRANYSSIELIEDVIEVNQVSDKLAIVIFRYLTECIRRQDGSAYGISRLETQVMIQEDSHCKLLHVHYSKS